MVVGVLELTLVLYDTSSLKSKRSVVRRVSNRIRAVFNAAAAEVDDLDDHDHAVLGVVVVANEHRFVESVLDKIERFVERLKLAELAWTQRAIDHY